MAEKKKTKEKEAKKEKPPINYNFNDEEKKKYLEGVQKRITDDPVVKNHHGKCF